MTDKLIAPRLCAWCGEPFTPDKYRRERHLSCSGLCARKLAGRKRRGQVNEAMLAGSLARHQARWDQKMGAMFGELSERERAIFKAGHTRGYDAGYNAAIRPPVKGQPT